WARGPRSRAGDDRAAACALQAGAAAVRLVACPDPGVGFARQFWLRLALAQPRRLRGGARADRSRRRASRTSGRSAADAIWPASPSNARSRSAWRGAQPFGLLALRDARRARPGSARGAQRRRWEDRENL